MPQVYSSSTALSSSHSVNSSNYLLSNFKSTLVKYQARFLNSSCPSLLKKITDVAKIILFTGIGLLLYWTNPTLFAMGFITGIIYDENVRKAITKIRIVWMTQTWTSCIIGGIASFLSLPVTLAASSFIWGANLGSKITQEALNNADEKLEMPLEGVNG